MNRWSLPRLERSLRPATRAAFLTLAALAATVIVSPTAIARGQSAADGPPPMDAGWPRSFATTGGDTLTVYQPQLDSWEGNRLDAHMAVESLLAGATVSVYGVATFTARTQVDRTQRTVYLEDMQFTGVSFPAAAERAAAFRAQLQSIVPARSKSISLDRLEMMLTMAGVARHADSLPLDNKPPAILFSTVPAVLVSVDGEPTFKPVKGTALSRVINTSPLLVLDNKAKVLYLHLFDGWMNAKTMDGPWTVTTSAPRTLVNDLNATLRMLVDSGEADPLEGAPVDPFNTTPSPSLLNPPVPVVHIATVPTELIVTEGEPKWEGVEGTSLSYIKNTTGRVLRSAADHLTYILLAGRWFRADSLMGPWQFVRGRDLPTDFAQIPDSSPVENVKAAVPGTPQAAEALIANTIPQTATLSKTSTAMPTIKIDGAPALEAIAGTSLQHVKNASRPLIVDSAGVWYACVNGAWFTAGAAEGPWSLATSVPASIYTIPPSSPLHYVTYVHVYGTTADSVYAGYTAGYTGAVVAVDQTVVYGTGYDYTPYVGDDWYAPPATWGYGANIAWTPWYGWRYGAGYGYAVGWSGYGVGAYRGVGRWGMGNWGVSSGNVYDQWGPRATAYNATAGGNPYSGERWFDRASVSYNSRTGIASAGQHVAVGNAFTGAYATGTRGVAYDTRSGQSVNYSGARGPNGGYAQVGNTVFADRNGNIYRHSDAGWQQNTRGGSWNSVNSAARANDLNRQRAARDMGEHRASGFSAAGGARRGTWGGARRR